ncbi:MAG TPA: hypothetical protein V6C81_23270 [Planktothrix sp.]|jgi:hypothetical protein
MPPTISEIETGLAMAEKAAPTVGKFLEDIPEIFGAAGKAFKASPEAEAVATRLFQMPEGAQMRPLLRAALATDDAPTLGAISSFWRLNSETRGMFDLGEVSKATEALRANTAESRAGVQGTISALWDMNRYTTPDKAASQILRDVDASGVQGFNSWTGRALKLSGQRA